MPVRKAILNFVLDQPTQGTGTKFRIIAFVTQPSVRLWREGQAKWRVQLSVRSPLPIQDQQSD
jgi:hypothetical protein